MIIHSYLTDGFYGWAELFVESFAFHHGHEHKIYLSSRDLTIEQADKLKSLYPNLVIRNKILDINAIAKRAKSTPENILKLKNHIENDAVNKKSFIWKQAISVEDRYKTSIIEVMKHFPDEDYLIHFDIDMYFRKPLTDLFEIIKSNDITIKFRLKSKLNRKVMGGLIGFKINKLTMKFMKRWVYHIERIPLYQKSLGYGQTSFYYAYMDLQDKLKWGNVPSSYISPRFKEDDFIWSGNTPAGKAKNLIRCRQDFNKRRKNANKKLRRGNK
jgi:hypothetical protein